MLSVVVFHAVPGLAPGGFFGVDIFFVISGFLITGHILERLDQRAFTLFDFYSRRIRRILPALIVVLIATLSVGWLILLGDELEQLGIHVLGGATFVSNFILMREAGYFDVAAHSKPLLHLWSLAIEEQFYIFWPILLWISLKIRLKIWIVFTLVFFSSLLMCLYLTDKKPTGNFYYPFTRIWELVAGALLAWWVRQNPAGSPNVFLTANSFFQRLDFWNGNLRTINFASEIPAIGGILCVCYSIFFLSSDIAHPSAWTLFPVLGAVLIILSGSKSVINQLLLTSRPAVWFGLISYPLYLWHWPILSFLHIYFGETPKEIYLLAAVATSVALAWCTYRFIERPIRFGWLKSKIRPLAILATLLALGAIGWSVGKLPDVASRGHENLTIQRQGFEHAIGTSLKWYHGQDGWLFLGNHYEDTVAKLKLTYVPDTNRLNSITQQFANVAKAAHEAGAKTAMLIGPNKSSVYADKLPTTLGPAQARYISPFISELNAVPHLLTIEPTSLLVEKKKAEGLLYWRTDTHWNQKGAFLAFEHMLARLGYSVPKVNFKLEGVKKGGLIRISGLDDFPLKSGDNWQYKVPNLTDPVREPHPNGPKPLWWWRGVVQNPMAHNDESVWVIGDSFTNQMRSFIEASFTEVRYIGHWNDELSELPELIENAETKPDLVMVVRVERSF